MIHREAGQAVFVHECELRRHALTVSWGAGYPAVDERSMPQVILPGGKSQFCPCGGDYTRVEPCPPGEHECDPIAGHVERSDDHTANLIETPEGDPEEAQLAELRMKQWRLEQEHLISELEGLLEADQLDERTQLATRIALIEAKRALRTAPWPPASQ